MSQRVHGLILKLNILKVLIKFLKVVNKVNIQNIEIKQNKIWNTGWGAYRAGLNINERNNENNLIKILQTKGPKLFFSNCNINNSKSLF